MSGGGGGGTSTTKTEIPAELKPLATEFASKAIDMSKQGFTPYTGQRFADLNGIQLQGIDSIVNRATNGSPIMSQANQSLMQTMQGGTNPYLDAMVNRAQANVLGNANQAAVRSGSFGNSGIAEAAARQMGDIATSMYGGAYESDAARRMQAMGMAPQFANQGYQDAQQLLNAGQILQDQSQQGKDFAYQQFQEGQNLPYKQLAAMSGVFNTDIGKSTTTTQSGGGK